MRYIDAEIALKIIDSYAKTVTADGKVVVDAIRDIVGVITPTADVVPKSEVVGPLEGQGKQLMLEAVETIEKDYRKQREGHWYKIDGFPRHHFCSKCHKGNRTKSNFCPNCGAKNERGE